MTKPLSPAAQAVKDAVLATYADNVPKDDSLWALERPSTVAALRAAADQVVPESLRQPHGTGFRWGGWAAKQGVRDKLLAIVAELEGTNG